MIGVQQPQPGVPPDWREGNSCPVCGSNVDAWRHDPPRQAGRDMVIGSYGAVLLPCRHFVGRVLPPGNRVGFP